MGQFLISGRRKRSAQNYPTSNLGRSDRIGKPSPAHCWLTKWIDPITMRDEDNDYFPGWPMRGVSFVPLFHPGIIMPLFSADKLKRRRIEIDCSEITSDSPEVLKRLGRIDANYQQLDSMLSEIEATIAGDQKLSQINASIKSIDLPKKNPATRKWRRPNKPR